MTKLATTKEDVQETQTNKADPS